jgi:hypothetical protein
VSPDRIWARRDDFEVEFDLAQGTGTLWCTADAGGLSSGLRIVLSRLLPLRCHGMLLHGAGVLIGGHAWILFGESGSGKSTAAGHLSAHPLLSDEIVAIGLGDGGWPLGFGTPFSGTLEGEPVPGGLPVGGLFELDKAKRLTERRLTRTDGIARLLASVLMFGDASDVAGRLLELADSMAAAVGVSVLSLPRSGEVRDFLEGRAADLPAPV